MTELNVKNGYGHRGGAKVFAAECRETKRPGMWMLSFDMTDYQSSVTVRKYTEGQEALALQSAIAPGMWLRVQGQPELTRDGKDIQLKPYHIMKVPHEGRKDTAPEKRVELHLHTKMSNMDALTDTASVIKQAISWGASRHRHHRPRRSPVLPGCMAHRQGKDQDPLRRGGVLCQQPRRPHRRPRSAGSEFCRRDRVLRHRDHGPEGGAGRPSRRSAPWCCATVRWRSGFRPSSTPTAA